MEWVVWGGLLVTMLALLTAYVVLPARPKPLPVLGALPDFALTDQNNQDLTLASLHGEVWIADAIFTRCSLSQCPIMSAHMQGIQDALVYVDCPSNWFSFTTDSTISTRRKF